MAFLLKLDGKGRYDIITKLGLEKKISDFRRIEYFNGVQGSKISFKYYFIGDRCSGTLDYRFDLPEGMTIQGDIRPMMDGFTYKEKGLFGGKKTYSYANDPDKDKGPTFDE